MAFDEMKSVNAVENWCVILQSYSPKLKKDLVKKLIDIFELDKRDAEQALSNTPLILLDNLSFGMAARVKNHFAKTNAVVETTNHDMIKKNCYQIVWPSMPDLSFFLKEETVTATKPAPPAEKQAVEAPAKPEPKKSLFEKLGALDKKAEPAPAQPAAPAPEVKKEVEKAPPAEPAKQPAPVPAKDDTRAKELEGQNAAFAKEAEALKARCTQLGEHLRELEDLLVQKESLIKDAEQALLKAHEKDDRNSAQIKQLQENLSQHKEGAVSDKEGAQALLAEWKTRLANLEGTLATKEKECTAAQSAVAEWKNKAAGLERALAEKEQGHSSAQASLAEWKTKISNLEGALAGKENECFSMQGQLGELRKKVGDLEGALAAKEKEGVAAREAIQKWEEEIANFEKFLITKKNECADLQTTVEEWKAKASNLENSAAEKDKECSTIREVVQQREGEVAELRKVLAAKDSERAALQSTIEEWKAKVASFESQIASRDSEIAGLRSKASEASDHAQALQRSLTELSNALRENEETLKSRDAAIQSAEQKIADLTGQLQNFEKIRQEHAQFSAERATIRREFEAKFAEQDARFAKIEEENRRYRSRMERKVTAATRELGEWVRGVEGLRQGLQKLTMFLGSDSSVQDPEKKSPLRSIFNKPANPPENNPK